MFGQTSVSDFSNILCVLGRALDTNTGSVFQLHHSKSTNCKGFTYEWAVLGQTKKYVFPVTCFLKLGKVGRIIFLFFELVLFA